VALYIEDTEFVAGRLNQQPCQVGKFTSTLRLRLFREFLGQMPSDCCSLADAPLPNKALSLDRHRQPGSLASQGPAKPPAPDLTDPCSDVFYKQVLLKYAAQNTRIYDLVFKVIPCDYVSNFEQLKEYHKHAGKMKGIYFFVVQNIFF
jgi:hypothetical protein